MEFGATSDAGWIGDVQSLADELLDSSAEFSRVTATVPGGVFIALRSMPSELSPRSFTRYERSDGVLYVDLRVAEEDIAGLTLEEQRRLLGPLLVELVTRGTKTRTAPWSEDERTLIRVQFELLLSSLAWITPESSL